MALKELGIRGLILERGVTFIDALLAHLELLPNFRDENLTAFRLIFMAKI